MNVPVLTVVVPQLFPRHHSMFFLDCVSLPLLRPRFSFSAPRKNVPFFVKRPPSSTRGVGCCEIFFLFFFCFSTHPRVLLHAILFPFQKRLLRNEPHRFPPPFFESPIIMTSPKSHVRYNPTLILIPLLAYLSFQIFSLPGVSFL